MTDQIDAARYRAWRRAAASDNVSFFAEFVAQIDNGEAPTEDEIDAGIDAAIQCMEEMELCVTR